MLRSLLVLYSTLLSFGAAGNRHWSYHKFETGPWEPPHLALQKTGDVAPGSYFISVRNPSHDGTAPTIYGDDGEVVWAGPEETTMDFKVQKLFGRKVLTFWSGETGVSAGYGYGTVHILDNTYREIYTITLQDNIVTPDGKPRDSYIDVHEHYITPHNTIIVTAINVTQADLTSVGGQPGDWLINNHFYEIDPVTNQVLFVWDALDHLDQIPIAQSKHLIRGSGKSQDTPYDAYHLNSVTSTKEGYLISIRFLFSAFYLNHDGGVRWQLSGADDGEGDFTGEGLRFTWQHDIRVHNETDQGLILSLFNNANNIPNRDGESTGMTFNVDLVNRHASNLRNVSDPSQPLYAKTQGSFQFLPAHVAAPSSHAFLDYGSDPFMKEFDADGNTVLTATFGGPPAESYRGFKYIWSATPHWDPAVNVTTAPDGTVDVYMSWNGATEYDSWAIYDLPNPVLSFLSLDKKRLKTQSKTGFETHVNLGYTNARHIQVVAHKGDSPMRASRTVSVEQSV